MTDISDLPLRQFISGSLLPGGDDLARMEEKRSELDLERAQLKSKVLILPEQRRRALDLNRARIDLLSQAIMSSRERIRGDQFRMDHYHRTRAELDKTRAEAAELISKAPIAVEVEDKVRRDKLRGGVVAEIEAPPREMLDLQKPAKTPKPAALYPIDTKQPPAAATVELSESQWDSWFSGRPIDDPDFKGR